MHVIIAVFMIALISTSCRKESSTTITAEAQLLDTLDQSGIVNEDETLQNLEPGSDTRLVGGKIEVNNTSDSPLFVDYTLPEEVQIQIEALGLEEPDVNYSEFLGPQPVSGSGLTTFELAALDLTDLAFDAECNSGDVAATYSAQIPTAEGLEPGTYVVCIRLAFDIEGTAANYFAKSPLIAVIAGDSIAPTGTSLSIAGGNAYTNTTGVTLTLAATEASAMYLTNTAGCTSGGSWETYATSKSWTLAQTNTTATVYAKFRDTAENESDCISDTIIHDDVLPTAPASLNDGSTQTGFSASPTITWAASSDASGIERYEVALGTSAGASDTVDFTSVGTSLSHSFSGAQLLLGRTYYASVRAIDNAGNASTNSAGDGFVVTAPPQALMATYQHTCAILDDDSTICWGNGANGRLGYGNTTTIGDDETPDSAGALSLGASLTSTQMSGGQSLTCTILSNDGVKCWGGDGVFSFAGYSSTAILGDDETPDSYGTIDLGVGRTASAIASGLFHNCVIMDNDEVRCWGIGAAMGLSTASGIGDNETPGSVGSVNLGVGRTAKAITAGDQHTCVILDNDTTKCWGAGGVGRLGYGNTDSIGDNETPDTVGTVNLGVGNTAMALTAGEGHTCALLTSNQVKCWGRAIYGNLGYGNTTVIGDDETPVAVGTVNLGSGRSANAIAAGDQHTCALLDNHQVKCWGRNNLGQLGYGHTDNLGDDETPDSYGTVDLGSGRSAVSIAAGRNHTCAVLDNSEVKCWGDNGAGQLGQGNTDIIGDDETPASLASINLGSGRTAKTQ